MALFLYRLGRASFRRRRAVVAGWVAVLALVAIGAASLSGATSDTFSIPGTESQRALDLLDERMPEAAADGATARLVFFVDDADADARVTDPELAAAISATVAEVAGHPHVAAATDPFASGSVAVDERTALANVVYTVDVMSVTDDDRTLLMTAVDRAVDSGLEVAVSGNATSSTPHAGATSEIIGLAVAALVLVLTFGSFVAAGLPLLTAILGVALGLLGIQIATGFADLSSTTPTLATMLGLAVGIDYALFIVSRYRHELHLHRDGEEAVGRALGTAGSAVVFAGLTVAIALTALSVVGIPFLTAMGLFAAMTVLLAVLIALTLLPALLGFVGPRRILGRRGFAAHEIDGEELDGRRAEAPRLSERWAGAIIRRPVTVVLVVVAALGVVAIPALDLRLGLPTDATAAPDSTQRQAYDRLSQAFGPGFNGTLLVAVDLDGVTGDTAAAVATVEADLASTAGIARVSPATTNAAGDLAIVPVVPTTGPSDSATEALVRTIREQADVWQQSSGVVTSVTGETAVAIDVSDKLADALLPYLMVVVGLALVLLTLVFRSLLIPVKAAVGFLLSVVATFGAVVAVFQWGWLADVIGIESTGPIVSFLPILLVGLLFGLAMDYEVFLVTRMREDFVHGASADDAIRLGFRHGARVVSAAALIMIAVFGGFIFMDDPIIKSIGFALALGVAIDAFVVRMTLVPALLALLGRHAWWLPRWLDRAMPDVDIEGNGLTGALDTTVEEPEPVLAGR